MVEQNIILGLLIIFGLAIILFVLVNMRKNNAKLIEMSFINIANKILEEKTNSLSQKNFYLHFLFQIDYCELQYSNYF